jgi:hypothetical protein
MKLTIDNFDSAGSRDYTAALATGSLPRITRHLNRPAETTFALIAPDPLFVVPAAGARIVLARADGIVLFTGYVARSPDREYLGEGERGPQYRCAISAVGDEFILDRRRLPERPSYVNRYAGDILIDMASALLPGAFTTAPVENGEAMNYSATPSQPFSHHAAELALRTRALYRAHNGELTLQPLGRNLRSISESDANFSPDALALRSPDRLANDVAVFGNVEPQAWVKNYFLGDGLSLFFNLSHQAFDGRTATLLEEEFAAALSPSPWRMSGSAWVGNGALNLAGAATVALNDWTEVGAALTLQHGVVTFTGATSGILGGLYNGVIDAPHCAAGFQCTPSGAATRIQPIVNGGAYGAAITTIAGHTYALTTRIFATEPYRRTRAFHSSAHPAGNPRGNADVAADVRAILDVHDLDPANPGSVTFASTVLFDGYIGISPLAAYALVNASDAHAAISFTRLLRAADIQVQSTIPGDYPRSRVIGPLFEGGECTVGASLSFHPEYVPPPNTTIRVAYRSSGRSVARITDPASIAQHARTNDNGVRVLATGLDSPVPRTSAECADAARALLDDLTQPAWTGEYSCWSHLLPQLASDVWPGDAVSVNAPSRSAVFTATVREVTIDVTDLATDISRYTFRFANDAAEPLSFRHNAQAAGSLANVVADQQYIADLPNAEMTSLDSVTLYIDAGAAPPPGGGIEIRRSDYGWSFTNDRNLITRSGSRAFAVTRLSARQTIYLRQYDASGHYSRNSTALYIDYPL